MPRQIINMSTATPQTQNNAAPAKNAKRPVLPDAEYNKVWDQEKNYKFVKRFNDPRFGEITVVKNPTTNHVLLVKEKMVSGKNEATDDIENLKSRLAINHPNMMRMVAYTTSVKKELCSTHYLSRAFYEFPKTDVLKEIGDRKRELVDFNDRELTHMLYQSAFAVQNLHGKNMVHGDIRPQLIGYDKPTGQYALLDRFADPTPLERCQSNNIVNNKELYLGPQLYKKLKGGDKKSVYDPKKNDMFALGMTMLHTGTMDSMQDNYLPNGTLNAKKMDEHLAEFNTKYGQRNPLLVNTVRQLLSAEETQRPDVNQLIASLPSYDQFKQIEQQGGAFGTQNGQAGFNNQQNVIIKSSNENDGYFNDVTVPNQTHGNYYNDDSNKYILNNNSQHNNQLNQGGYAQNDNFNNQPYSQPHHNGLGQSERHLASNNPGFNQQNNQGINQQPIQQQYQQPIQYNSQHNNFSQLPPQNYSSQQNNYHPHNVSYDQSIPLNTTHINYAQPHHETNYSYSTQEPSVITYTRPITQNVNAYPVNYVNATPAPIHTIHDTNYVNAAPSPIHTVHDTSYISHKVSDYNPTSTYISTEQAYTPKSNLRYSHSYVDNNRVRTAQDNVISFRTANAPAEITHTQYVAPYVQTHVVSEAPTTRFETRRSYVHADRELYAEPRVIRASYNVPTTTRVVHESVPETRVIGNIYDSSYGGHDLSTNYVTEQRKSIRFLNAEQVHKPVNVHSAFERLGDHTSHTSNGFHQHVISHSENPQIEVRRGTTVPPSDYNAYSSVSKKRYVMREDGTVVEVNDDAKVGAYEVQTQF